MASIPQKVHDRLVAGIKKFQPILTAAHNREANESDTVIIITAILGEVFGYDTFKEITSEIAIRGTYCDLATKFDDKIQSLIEAKAINLELKDNHVTQAVGYASIKGVEIDFLKLDYHKADDLDSLFLLTKESWVKSALTEYYDKYQALSPYIIGQVILSEPVLTAIKRELKHISPEVKIEIDKIFDVLERDVLKHDVVEGDKAVEAHKRVANTASRAKRNKAEKDLVDEGTVIALPIETSKAISLKAAQDSPPAQ